MLKSYEAIYDHGQIRWLDVPPDVETARVIVTVLPPQGEGREIPTRPRRPPARLKGTARALGDIVTSPLSEKEWVDMLERSARQLKGDPEAFK